MCGINGYYSVCGGIAGLAERAGKLSFMLRHRGPDECGSFVSDKLVLFHRRLKIIGLSNGKQPIFNEDKGVVLAVNGEIYNYVELRSELEKKGHIFRTDSDSEVLTHLYEEYGMEALAMLNGMFSGALYDACNGKFFLFRDRYGQKPIYYKYKDGIFSFASSARVVNSSFSQKENFNFKLLHSYFLFGYIPWNETFFENIYSLLPGHYIEVDGGGVKDVKYYEINSGINANLEEGEVCARTFELLRDSVRLRMRSDVPYGVLLSGGIDSSIIAYFMAEEGGGSSLKAFTVAFDEWNFDESEYAGIVAKYFGAEHYRFFLKPDFFNFVDDYIDSLDSPFFDSSSLALYLLSKEVSREVKTALCGDGGDELFGGYDRYRGALLRMKLSGLLKNKAVKGVSGILVKLLGIFNERTSKSALIKAKRYLNGLAFEDDFILDYLSWFPNFTKADAAVLGGDKYGFYGADFPIKNLNDLLKFDFSTYLPSDILYKSDSMSMAHSLELRAPFLDYRLVDYIFSVPPSLKTGLFSGKKILKKIFSGKLPPAVLKRRKQGFGVPVGEWLRGDIRSFAESVLFCEDTILDNILNSEYIKKIFCEHIDGIRDHTYRLWSLMVLKMWVKRNFE